MMLIILGGVVALVLLYVFTPLGLYIDDLLFPPIIKKEEEVTEKSIIITQLNKDIHKPVDNGKYYQFGGDLIEKYGISDLTKEEYFALKPSQRDMLIRMDIEAYANSLKPVPRKRKRYKKKKDNGAEQ